MCYTFPLILGIFYFFLGIFAGTIIGYLCCRKSYKTNLDQWICDSLAKMQKDREVRERKHIWKVK